MGISASAIRIGLRILTAAAIDKHPGILLRNDVLRKRELKPALVVQRLRARVRPVSSSVPAAPRYCI